MADNQKIGQDREHRIRDYVVYFIVAFVLIFLTSSFVIESVYDSADGLTVSPEGVSTVYMAAIGGDPFGKAEVKDSESENETENDTSTQTEQNEVGTTKTDN